MWAIACTSAARPSSLPRRRRGTCEGCTSSGLDGRPGALIGWTGNAESHSKAPRSTAPARADTAEHLSCGSARARHSELASNSLNFNEATAKSPIGMPVESQDESGMSVQRRSIRASAKPEVETSVAPSIWRAKSYVTIPAAIVLAKAWLISADTSRQPM